MTVKPEKPDESNADAQLELGVSLCRLARWREAIEPLQRAVAIDPNRAAAHYQLGEALNAVDRLAEALEAYETAAKLQPDHLRALKGIGVVLDRRVAIRANDPRSRRD